MPDASRLKSIEQLADELHRVPGLKGKQLHLAFFGGRDWMLKRNPLLATGTWLEHGSPCRRPIRGRRFSRQPRARRSRARAAAHRGATRAGPSDDDPHEPALHVAGARP